jgi:hypothetical protein
MEVIQVFDRPASRGFYSVAGRLLFIESFDLELRDLIADLLNGWQLTAVTSPDRSPDILIEFRCGPSPEIPRHLDCFEIAEGGKCYTNGAGFYLALGDAVVQLVNGNPVTVSVSLARLPGFRDPLLARAASFAVCSALRRFGIFELHSAGVIEPSSGKAVLIVGPSGSGKSTLALQLASSGWSYLSDDELLLTLVDDAVEARGFRSFFAVSTGEKFKHCFEPESVFESKRVQRASVGSVVFTRVSGAEKSELRELTQAEAMTRLIHACPWATYDTSIASANLVVLSALARQARSFDLLAGRDLLQTSVAASLLGHR